MLNCLCSLAPFSNVDTLAVTLMRDLRRIVQFSCNSISNKASKLGLFQRQIQYTFVLQSIPEVVERSAPLAFG